MPKVQYALTTPNGSQLKCEANVNSTVPTPPLHPSGLAHLLIFRLNERRYALAASVVERVTWMVSITRLPAAPSIVLGVVNVQGRVMPVVDTRQRFGLPTREVEPGDKLIIARTARRALVLAVDQVDGVLEYPERNIDTAGEIVPGTDYVQGVAKLDDGLVLIHDLDTFLSLDEEVSLDQALDRGADRDTTTRDGSDGK